VPPYNYDMASARPENTALSVAFDLFETGVALMRQNLRREHPNASDGEIDRLLTAWLRHRPGAEAGDAIGRSVDPHTRLR
jgi:hypothetical protein